MTQATVPAGPAAIIAALEASRAAPGDAATDAAIAAPRATHAIAREDDAQGCLGAALDMLVALESFNAANGTAIGMHIGINTGEVIAGGIGGAGRQD